MKILKRTVKGKPRLYEYMIRGPADRQLFYSEEAIRTFLGTVPRMRLRRIDRFPDHDIIYVFGLARNVLAKRATIHDRAAGRGLLSDFGAMTESERTVKPAVREACAAFLANHDLDSLKWLECRGMKIDRRNPEKKTPVLFYKIVARKEAKGSVPSAEYDSRKDCGSLAQPLRALIRICTGTLPFNYEAAHP